MPGADHSASIFIIRNLREQYRLGLLNLVSAGLVLKDTKTGIAEIWHRLHNRVKHVKRIIKPFC